MLAILLSAPHLKGVSKRTKEPYDFYSLNFCALLARVGYPPMFISDKINLPKCPIPAERFPLLCDLSFDNNGHLIGCSVVSDSVDDFPDLFFRVDSSSDINFDLKGGS